MENRASVIADYFKLRLLLNRTNLVRDLKTEIEFVAIKKGTLTYGLIATLAGLAAPKRLELCTQSRGRFWEAAGHSGLNSLEEFCAAFLRKNLGRNFTLEDLTQVVASLKKELQNLGIPHK